MKTKVKSKAASKIEPQKIVFKDYGNETQTVDIARLFSTINEYAPAELLDELSSIGDMLEQMAWKCGWKTDELYRVLEANGHKQNYMAVCYYVSATRLRFNKSMNTVKAWAMTARFFPEKIARKYHFDFLPFATFTYAASWGETPAPPSIRTPSIQYMWQAVLTYAWGMYCEDGYGRCPTVEQLKVKFEGMSERESKKQKAIEEFTPDADMAIENAEGDDRADVEFIHSFVQALHIVMNGLPRLGRWFPKASQTLSGYSLRLNELVSHIEKGEDLE